MAWDAARATAIIDGLKHQDGAALPIFHALQAAFGHVPQEAVPLVAEALNLSRAEMHGVVSFYHDFKTRPPGRLTIRLCQAEACQSTGALDLGELVRDRFGIGFGGTTADGLVTLEPAYCLGLCACAPAGVIAGELHGRLDAEELTALIDEALG